MDDIRIGRSLFDSLVYHVGRGRKGGDHRTRTLLEAIVAATVGRREERRGLGSSSVERTIAATALERHLPRRDGIPSVDRVPLARYRTLASVDVVQSVLDCFWLFFLSERGREEWEGETYGVAGFNLCVS